jgi:2-desacetyl-2-hydroxyethyl bacteriochlorophyllide A dehydrogenase
VHTEALVFTDRHRCEITSYDLPETLGPHEVLIRNRYGLISPGTELAMFNRTHRGFEVDGHWARYPYYPGYCNVGVVQATGDAVQDPALAPGARVVHQSNHATWTRQPVDALIAVPPELADERAVFTKMLGIALTPQLLAPLRFGESVLVIGAGLVGNLAAQLGREAGGFPVLVVDRSHARTERAAACGLDARTAIDGCDADYVIEAVGSAAALQSALGAVRADGRLVLLSSSRERVEIDPYFDIHHRGVQLIGAHEWRRDRAQRAPYDPFLAHLLTTGRVQVDPLVTHTVVPADAQRAYEGLRDDPDEWLGVLLDYGA